MEYYLSFSINPKFRKRFETYFKKNKIRVYEIEPIPEMFSPTIVVSNVYEVYKIGVMVGKLGADKF